MTREINGIQLKQGYYRFVSRREPFGGTVVREPFKLIRTIRSDADPCRSRFLVEEPTEGESMSNRKLYTLADVAKVPGRDRTDVCEFARLIGFSENQAAEAASAANALGQAIWKSRTSTAWCYGHLPIPTPQTAGELLDLCASLEIPINLGGLDDRDFIDAVERVRQRRGGKTVGSDYNFMDSTSPGIDNEMIVSRYLESVKPDDDETADLEWLKAVGALNLFDIGAQPKELRRIFAAAGGAAYPVRLTKGTVRYVFRACKVKPLEPS